MDNPFRGLVSSLNKRTGGKFGTHREAETVSKCIEVYGVSSWCPEFSGSEELNVQEFGFCLLFGMFRNIKKKQ